MIRTGQTIFRPRARLIRLLGEELISDEVTAIVELVKNAFDADASSVTVAVKNLNRPERTSITVRDDGTGMTLETLLNAWLEPATSFKRRNGHKVRTAGGRYPLGEKGVGRFAADKLGARLDLRTRALGTNEEARLKVDWDAFLGGRYLDEVTSIWEISKPKAFTGKRHGTELRITSVRVPWDTRMVERVHQGLARLVSPATGDQTFRIVLDCPELPDLSGVIESRLLESAPYRLAGRVTTLGYFVPDGGGIAVDLRRHCGDHFRRRSGSLREPECGPFQVRLSVWDLDALGQTGVRVSRPIRALLRRTAGVSIYRDGFRVAPYGEQGDDWLELNQRRVNNPTLRVSTNQLVGSVEVTQEGNPLLRDRTSREGLVETRALHDLKALVVASLSLLEDDRYARRKATAPLPLPEGADPILEHLRRAAGEGSGRRSIAEATVAYQRYRQEMERREQVLVRLATVGAAAETLLGQLNGAVATLAGTMPAIQWRVSDLPVVTRAARQLQTVSHQLDALQRLFEGRPSTPTRFDLRGLVQDALEIYAPAFGATGVKASISGERRVEVIGDRVLALQALLHVVENGIVAASARGDERWLAVEVEAIPPRLTICDSGPGVPAERRAFVFDAFYTARDGSRGLGLFFARSLLRDQGFEVCMNEDGRGFALEFANRSNNGRTSSPVLENSLASEAAR